MIQRIKQWIFKKHYNKIEDLQSDLAVRNGQIVDASLQYIKLQKENERLREQLIIKDLELNIVKN